MVLSTANNRESEQKTEQQERALERLDAGSKEKSGWYAGEKGGVDAIEFLKEQGKISNHIPLLKKTALRAMRSTEYTRVSGAAISVLYHDPSVEALRATVALFKDPKLAHNGKSFILNHADTELRAGHSERALSFFKEGAISNDSFVRDHTLKLAEKLILDGLSRYRTEMRNALKNGLFNPATEPKSIDNITREEYSSLDAAEHLANIGDYTTLIRAVQRVTELPATVKDRCVELLGRFAKVSEVEKALRMVVDQQLPGHSKATAILKGE